MENNTLYIVIAGLWLAVGFGIFLKKLDMPVIIGYICTGTVLAAFLKLMILICCLILVNLVSSF